MARLYEPTLECHVEVAQGDGERDGKCFTNGKEKWYSFRIQDTRSANATVGWEFNRHVLCIGLSGWDFHQKVSRWVGFDFDSIVGHKRGLTEDQLNEIVVKLKDIPWVTIRKSTGGKGLHVYVPIATGDIRSECRQDHIGFAKGILSQLCALTGFDFIIKSDTIGSILWVWSRRQTTGSFQLIKEATEGIVLRADWKDNDASKKKRTAKKEAAANVKVEGLSEEHRRLIDWFAKGKDLWYWDNELHMLVCHTFSLKMAHTDLQLKGIYDTVSTGKDLPNDQNAFAFPIKNGGWIVRRHSRGTREHPYWKTDKSGWTYCLYNRLPTLSDISSYYGGGESARGDYCFSSHKHVESICKVLAPTAELQFPLWAGDRQVRLKALKDAKVAITFDSTPNDPLPIGWIRGKGKWERVISILEEERELKTPDDMLRHTVTEGKDAGWYLKSKDWTDEPVSNAMYALGSMGYSSIEVKELIGQCVLNPWILVNKPFEVEYPGNREWNKFAAQLSMEPKEGPWPTWKLVFDHWGKGLNQAVSESPWCITNGIRDGASYLLYWFACVFQYPTEPLPYLFVFGPEKSGKSSLHEFPSLLVNRGVIKAGQALVNPQGFNGELAGAIICVNDEINLSVSRVAHDRIKEWTTAKTITIRALYQNAFDLPNTTHWIQCANQASWCPIKLGDTRIVMWRLDKPESEIPKELLLSRLRDEIAAFLWFLTHLEIPETIERLRIPPVETAEKREEVEMNIVERFIAEKLYPRKGQFILFSDFCNQFWHYCETIGVRAGEWSKQKIGSSIPMVEGMPIKGRSTSDNQVIIGNYALDASLPALSYSLVKVGEKLVRT